MRTILKDCKISVILVIM